MSDQLLGQNQGDNNGNGKSKTVTDYSIQPDSHNFDSNYSTLEEKKPGNSLILGLLLGIIGTVILNNVLSNKMEVADNVTPPPVVSEKSQTSQAITTVTVGLTNVQNTLQANGTVVADELIPVMSQANNLQIVEVLVDEGDMVKAGQILMRLDDSVLQAELKQAQASVNQAQARLAELKAGARQEELARAKENIRFAQADVLQAESDLQLAVTRLERNRKLAQEGAIAQDRLDEFINDESAKKSNLTKTQARLRETQQQLQELEKGVREEVIRQGEASLTEALARVKLVEARLRETTIVSPVDGKVAERNARVGDVTSSFNSDKLLTIIQNNQLELQLRVPENELRNITSGQQVIISSSLGDSQITGLVRNINPVIDSQSRQGVVNVDLPADNNLKPGMFIRGTIITGNQSRITIPTGAVLPQSNGNGIVYVLQDDNTVKSQQVTLGEIVENERVEVLSGLNVGDAIALRGIDFLQDGMMVTVTDAFF